MARVEAIKADITGLEVDAIVNAANEQLHHGGGVALAISRAGGPSIDAESAAWVRANGPVRPGQAAVTGGGELPARWVIHVVGPRYRAGQDNESLLRGAVVAALDAAADLGAESIALPAISAGIFGYPRHEAAKVIADSCVSWPGPLEEILLVGYDEATHDDLASALEALR